MPWTLRDVSRFTKTPRTNRQKRQWVRVANSALARCLADGGSTERCEASAIRQANGVVSNARNEGIPMDDLFFAASEITGDVREEVLHGALHLVRPLKIIRPMVLNGVGDGPQSQLLPSDELSHCPIAAWNNIPLVGPTHPYRLNEQNERVYQSANNADMLRQFQVGIILNAHRDEQGRIAGEAWLNVDNCDLMGGRAADLVSLFRSNETAEISSAYHFRLDPSTGQHEGVTYNAVQRDIHPDHVAILMDSVGACSRPHCGLGVNCSCEGEKGAVQNEEGLVGRFLAAMTRLLTNNATFGDIHMAVQQKVSDRFGDMTMVHEVEDNPRRAVFMRQGKMVALPFSVDAQGRVTLSASEPEPVQRSTTFVANEETPVEKILTLEQLHASADIDDAVKSQIRDALAFHEAETAKQAAAREEKVVALAANEGNPFSLEELKTMSDEMLAKLEAMPDKKVSSTNYGPAGGAESVLGQNEKPDFSYLVPSKPVTAA